MRLRLTNHLLLAGVSLAAFPVSAMAQDAAAGAAAPETGIQEIIVTATRAETSAQRTAVALTVYTGADLAEKGIATVQALSAIDPSVNVTSSTGAAYVAVRGVASTDVTEVGDPSVPIARDGFYTNRSFSIGTSMYDLARVEVLKGPQGTLNGRNSTGGLVSIITNRPGKDAGAFGSIEVGNYDALNVEAGANVPVNDRLQFRISGTHRQHDGYRKLTVIDDRGDDDNTTSGRIQVAAQPVDGLKLWASYQHDDIHAVGDVAMTSPLRTRPDFGDAKSFPNYAETSNRLKGDRARWEASYDSLPGDLTLTYAGGYDHQTWKHALDGTGPGYPATRQFRQGEDPRTWNHEVRINNDPNGQVFFQAGYFHFQEDNTIDSGLFNVAMTGPFAEGGPLSDHSYAGQYGIKFDYKIKTKSDAVFGQVAAKLSEQLKLSVGGRYTWDSKVRTGNAKLIIGALASPFVPPFVTVTTDGKGDMKHGEATWHVGLDYTPSANTLVYAKYDRGYKAGGFNSNGSGASVDYAPEKLDAFEIGTKNRFMGNRLQLNAAAFYFNYKGYQASQTSCPTCSSGIFNVGSAKIYGAEIQTIALFGEGGRIDLNASYLHTRFGKDDNGNDIVVVDGDNPPNPFDITGNRLPNAPTMSISGGIEYAFPVGSGKLTPRIDGKYSSMFYYSVFNTRDTQSRPYATGNASLTYEPENGQWQVTAFVRNFTDKVVLANAQRNFVAGLNTYQFQPPRTWGVRFGWKI
ncbi:TonB-dependent receptor [Novosphingobium huizhouense]|uniref:TonB-dependent receptor n=1 Tax=Novosphingobium huizhouense TaxID=2866625 RepID=UPI001CD8F864|nr:TonB-dependent receptor [Novosphingobium huizhouense]